MSKMAAGLLLIVGLAVGLWLGFNPKAHAETVRDWSRLTESVAHMRFTSAAKLPTSQAPSTAAKPAPHPQISTSTAWRQVSAQLNTFWMSLQHLWRAVAARIGRTR
jgi:hypothetical protein